MDSLEMATAVPATATMATATVPMASVAGAIFVLAPPSVTSLPSSR